MRWPPRLADISPRPLLLYIELTNFIVEFISGFSGSAGTAVVSLGKAALSTDGRYFNQAAQQLDNNWELLKHGNEGVLSWQEWYDWHALEPLLNGEY